MHDDGPIAGVASDPRVARVLAEAAAIQPYLTTWLLAGKPGRFVIDRDADDDVIAISATVAGSFESGLVPFRVPGN